MTIFPVHDNGRPGLGCVIGFGMGTVVYDQLVEPPGEITSYLIQSVC
jgi:hypothetical protein